MGEARDDAWRALALAYSGRTEEAFKAAPAEWQEAWFDDTEALLPVVQALVAEGQAETLEAAANHGVCLIDVRQLRNKAAALRATTSGEGM